MTTDVQPIPAVVLDEAEAIFAPDGAGYAALPTGGNTRTTIQRCSRLTEVMP